MSATAPPRQNDHPVTLPDLFARRPVSVRDVAGKFDLGQEQLGWEKLTREDGRPIGADVWVCGTFALGVHPRDWTRWTLATRHPLDGLEVVAEGWTPPYGEDEDFYAALSTHPYVVQNGLEVPFDGLNEFLDYAQEMLLLADAAGRPRIGVLARDLSEISTDVAWLVPGVSAPGWFTILGGREKGGKGWLSFYLLGCLERGEESVFGPSGSASAVIYTEEPVESIEEKSAAFGLRDSLIVFAHHLAGLSWDEKVDGLVRAAVDGGHGVLFIDNASRATGVEDENGTELARLLEQLAEACKAEGIALLVNHHHKKGNASPDDKLRGGTALPAMADVIIDLVKADGRKRKLSSRGRLAATNWKRTVELDESSDGYTDATEDEATRQEAHGAADAYREKEAISLLRDHGPLTVAGFAKLSAVSNNKARRLLNRLSDDGVVEKDRPKGASANAAYEYRLPKVPDWFDDLEGRRSLARSA